MLFSVVFHFVTLQGHKAKPSKARGLKNEFLPRFVPKVPWLTAYWYYRYYWQKLDDIEVSLKNTGLSYSAHVSLGWFKLQAFLKITNVTGFSHAFYHKNYENAKKFKKVDI